MAEFERHVFVCTNERAAGHPRGCCSGRQSHAVRDALKQRVKQERLKPRVRINAAGCLDQCEHGVTVVVYPEAVWYGFVTEADVDDIVQDHLIGGRAVERLRLPAQCLNTTVCPHRSASCDTPRVTDPRLGSPPVQ